MDLLTPSQRPAGSLEPGKHFWLEQPKALDSNSPPLSQAEGRVHCVDNLGRTLASLPPIFFTLKIQPKSLWFAR